MSRIAPLVVLAVLLAGCGGTKATLTSAVESHTTAVACPKPWKAGWQRLANDAGVPVYCPSWMPEPLDAQIGGVYKNGRWVDKNDKSYLVSFRVGRSRLGRVAGGARELPRLPSPHDDSHV